MLESNIKIFNEYKKKIIAFNYLESLLNWDKETQAPLKSAFFRAEQIKILSNSIYELKSDEKFINSVKYLYDNINEINDPILRKEVIKQYKENRIYIYVPKDEYINYQVLLQKSTKVWHEARTLNDFNHFADVLEEIVEYNKRLTKYLETEKLKGYDVLLDLYEEGIGVKYYDQFFEYLKEELIPFVMEVTKGRKYPFNRKLTNRIYPINIQKEFSKYLINVLQFDLKKGAIRKTTHPFTIGLSRNDVRISSDYYENSFTTSIFSVMHEIGHGLYLQNNSKHYDNTLLFGGSSHAMHEACARMYENMIGRSFAFWNQNYNKLLELYPKQLKNINVLEFYRFINQAQRSKIRIEADELTYSLHIMVRYEIEKDLINNNLKVKDIPRRWRALMSKYVGVRPINDLEGSLQDIHWALGMFGYFPTYALGSAYAAQIYNSMNESINVESAIENNNFKLINNWMTENIFKYGASKNSKEILKIATNEMLNPKYYIKYLKNKYTKLRIQMKASMD